MGQNGWTEMETNDSVYGEAMEVSSFNQVCPGLLDPLFLSPPTIIQYQVTFPL